MANTPNERQTFKQALTLIASKYGQWIVGNPSLMALLGAPIGQFDAMVKFMDSAPFLQNLMLTGKPPVGCTVLGFADFLTNPPTIYINRINATASTIIHELLHFLTHDNFHRHNTTGVIEGTTEYFTRKTQGVADPVTHAQFTGARHSYDNEHQELLDARIALKGPFGAAAAAAISRAQPLHMGRHRNPGFIPDPLGGLPVINDFMKKAYFQGHMGSIALLKKILEL